jgi:predicted tellurium resistance membrane protein TerC/predicted transcriptional regulator
MEWIADPTAWVGLLTLVALEIVLGVDNLIFIAIIADKLPPEQRDRARVIGLSLALLMRLALLASISWVMSLTAPLLELWRLEISWRDLILIAGGLFLLVKATTEIHERLDAQRAEKIAATAPSHAAFWPLVAQIVVLDAVFSLDSVITAVGMVEQLGVMMVAVSVAVLLMLIASKPLTLFLLARPSLIILCLGFLLMVGLVLVVDGLGVHVPKGYVYSAIGFSLLIEFLNQWGERKRVQQAGRVPARARLAEVVLRLLGGVPVPGAAGAGAVPAGAQSPFGPEERRMVREVLTLAEKPVTAAMTQRQHIVWLDSAASAESILALVKAHAHHEFPVGRGSLDAVEGVVRKEDVLARVLEGGELELKTLARHCVTVSERSTLLEVLKEFKRSPIELAVIQGQDGKVAGVITRTDLLEAIAGDLPDLN